MEQLVYLLLEDGTVFTGKNFGAPLKEDVTAEVVFTTAMTGCTETLTDPSYYGQMVVQTFPLAGNYGIIPADFESGRVHMSAYITREYCKQPSNFRSQLRLDDFLKQQGVCGVYDLDTRSLTRHIREKGAMNGLLTTALPPSGAPPRLTGGRNADAVRGVTCREPFEIDAALSRFHVVAWDFGIKQNMLRLLHNNDCRVTVMPAFCGASDLLSHSPDGILLSNGPGNPEDNPDIVKELSRLCRAGIPIFGICLGHQLLALANGARTEKLKFGHRGSNQPVQDLKSNRIYITSQNHGYTVVTDSLPPQARLRFINLNDNTCEGIRYESFPGLSVQFHPEACSGPHDTAFLFQEFISLMERRSVSCH